uniref:Uncharacterized protein n=1 Tax=Ditylenchus dipsaci TaxID=166011 RepID=A0A915DZQ2_9BILA
MESASLGSACVESAKKIRNASKVCAFQVQAPNQWSHRQVRQQVQTAEIGVQTDVVLCDKQIQTGNGGATRDQAIQVIPGKLIHFSPTKIADSVAGLRVILPASPILSTKSKRIVRD